MKRRNMLNQLSFLAISEGISYLLFIITMPLKYYGEILLPNKIVGISHGLLFVLYCVWVMLVAFKLKWPLKVVFVMLLASLLPFATFWVEKKILKPLKEEKISPVKNQI